MPFFKFEGQRLAYTEFGGGPAELAPSGVRGRTAKSAPATGRALILLHGLLLSQEMHRPLAEDLAARGSRVITLDLLGHGRSERPRDMWRYSMASYGRQVVALLDHLQIDQAVVMGTSLGANVALEVAASRPERLRGLVIEMPVLDNGLLWSALTFTPLLVSLTGNVVLDLVRQAPGPSGALLQGLFFGRIAPPRSERSTFTTPTLVLGHPRDPVHPFSDADMLVKELPNGRLLRANSLVELRMQPLRLTEEIAAFIDEAWGKPASAGGAGRAPRRKAASADSASSPAPKRRAAAKRAPAKRSAS
jgi:pimeloyl-ACP methyl ester carboxylesterase